MRTELKEMFDIKSIVKSKAKYQKVMLLFDDSVSQTETRDIYELIREDCVFNQMHVADLDINELMNGYRLVIFYMTGQSYLCVDQVDEFVNIFIPTDEFITPFLATKSFSKKSNDYLILNDQKVDYSLLSSIYLNRTFTRIYNLIYSIDEITNFEQIDKAVCGSELVDIVNNEKHSLRFIDLNILKDSGLELDKLILLDFILLVAFEVLVQSVRNRTLSMIDVFKIAQNNDGKINTYYEMMNNYQLLEILNLNFNCLSNIIRTNKEYILEMLKNTYTDEDINATIKSIREVAKNDDGILGYMYFYNIFSY